MNQEKLTILHKLDIYRLKSLAAIEGINLQTIVHTDSGWTVKDFIAHIADWERQLVDALHAFLNGKTYAIPELETLGLDGFNAQMREAHLEENSESVLAHWQDVRESLKTVLTEIPDDDLSIQFSPPWDEHEHETCLDMVKGILWHEREHISDIVERCKTC